MKKQKQPVDRELVDRSFLSRIEPYLYLLPFLIGIAVFTLYPVINVVLMSFKEGYSYLSHSFDQWGLANYQTVLSDPKFAQAISNTLKYVILVVPISTCIAVVVAYLLNQKLRFSALFQTAYFLPCFPPEAPVSDPALPRGDFPSIPFRPLFRHKKEAASSHPRITAPPVLPPAAAELSPLRNDFSGEPLHCGTAVYCRTGKDIPIRTIVHFAWHSTYYHHIHDMLQFPGKCLIHTCRKNPGQAADHLVDLFCRHVKAFERR